MSKLGLVPFKDISMTNENNTTFQKDFGCQFSPIETINIKGDYTSDNDYDEEIDFYIIEDDENDNGVYYELENITQADPEPTSPKVEISPQTKGNRSKAKVAKQQKCKKCSIKKLNKATQCNNATPLQRKLWYWQKKVKRQQIIIKRLKQILKDNIRLSSFPLIKMPISETDLANMERQAELSRNTLNFVKERRKPK